jgi:hypothetical protein
VSHRRAFELDSVNDHDENHMDRGSVLIHDLRNLLAVIVNYSELIGEELNDPDAIRADIAEVKTAAERAIAMTDRLPRNGTPAA